MESIIASTKTFEVQPGTRYAFAAYLAAVAPATLSLLWLSEGVEGPFTISSTENTDEVAITPGSSIGWEIVAPTEKIKLDFSGPGILHFALTKIQD
jgi:hypothetical protein